MTDQQITRCTVPIASGTASASGSPTSPQINAPAPAGMFRLDDVLTLETPWRFPDTARDGHENTADCYVDGPEIVVVGAVLLEEELQVVNATAVDIGVIDGHTFTAETDPGRLIVKFRPLYDGSQTLVSLAMGFEIPPDDLVEFTSGFGPVEIDLHGLRGALA